MRILKLTLTAALLASIPAPAMADDGAAAGPAADHYVLSVRADFIQVHSDVQDFFALGGSAGLHIPFGELPLGLEVMTSLGGGDGHVLSTNDVSLRYYLPSSGGNSHTLQPYVKAGPTLTIALWEEQGAGPTVGAVLGLGLHAWLSGLVGLTFEFTYRVMGGDELRQTMMLSTGVALRL